MKLTSKLVTVIGGILLQTTSVMALATSSPTAGAVDLGQVPGLIVIKKEKCYEPTHVDYCILPNSSDIREEIRIFLADADRRKRVIQSRMPLLLKAANKLRESAGTNSSLPSYSFYMKAAQQVAGITTDEKTMYDIAFFDKKHSPVMVLLEQLLKVTVSFESQIARATDPAVREGLMIGRNETVLQTMKPIYDLRAYADHLGWRYFSSEMNVLMKSSYASIDDPRRFNLDPYINIVNLCCNGDTGVNSVAITKAAQAGQFDSLALLEDQVVIKGLLDGPVLTFQSQKVFGSPELRYDRATNTITREYMQRGRHFVKNGDKIWSNQSLVQFVRDIYQN